MSATFDGVSGPPNRTANEPFTVMPGLRNGNTPFA